ncbi:MAG: DUF1847 domain-containing protein [Eubacteriales bacterium]|nr:DUF1847 domain-containing protein [Eubacteriales bacterium]
MNKKDNEMAANMGTDMAAGKTDMVDSSAKVDKTDNSDKYASRCAWCGVEACCKDSKDNLPIFCPMDNNPEISDKALAIVNSPDYNQFYQESARIEHDGYGRWPRVRETLELIRRMGYKKVGLAFCHGLVKEAEIFAEICRENDIELVSAMCKTGGVDKSEAGVAEEDKFEPAHFEAMCNPVAQAMILNEAKTEFNILLGLCVGHDSLFCKFSDALCTTLVVKDRATGHNPVVALYQKDGYFQSKLDLNNK